MTDENEKFELAWVKIKYRLKWLAALVLFDFFMLALMLVYMNTDTPFTFVTIVFFVGIAASYFVKNSIDRTIRKVWHEQHPEG